MEVLSDCGLSTTAVADAAGTNKTLKSSEKAKARARAEGVLRRTRVQKDLVATADTQPAPGQPLETFNLAGSIGAFHQPKGMPSARLAADCCGSEREMAL
jgi:hypothetical protein